MPGVDLDIELKLDDKDLKALAASVQSQINAGLGGLSLPRGMGATSAGDAGLGGVAGGADKANRQVKALQDEVDRLAQSDLSGLNHKLGELLKVEKFEKFRSWLSDVRDAFDITAQSLLGFTDKEAKAASEAAYLTEKGIAVGGAFGPWGSIIGGAAGALAGLVHYMKETDDTAEKLHEAMQKQISDAKEMQALWGQLNGMLGTIQESSEETAGGFFTLSERIKNTLNPQELPKGAAALNKEIETLKASLETTSDSAAELGREVERLSVDADLLRATENPGQSKLDELANIEGELAEKKKILAQSTKNLEPILARYNELQSASAQETSKASSSIKDRTEAQRKLNEQTEKFFKLFDSSATREADAIWQRQLDQMDEITQAFSNPPDANTGDSLLGFMQREAVETESKLADLGLRFDEARQAFVALDELPSLQEILGDAQGLDALKETADGLAQIGEMARTQIAGVAKDSLDAWLESVATGEKLAPNAFKAIRAAAVREIGTELFADGVKNELEGLGKFVSTGGLLGKQQMAVGAAEMVAGLGMGAIGATRQRSLGFGDDKTGGGVDGGRSLPDVDRAAQGTAQLPTMIVYMGSAPGGGPTIYSGTGEEAKAQAGRWVKDVSAAADRAGPALKGGR